MTADASSPAPGELELVRQFVNSVDLEEGRDEWVTPRALGTWLAARDLLASSTIPGAKDLDRARALRDALRELLETHHGNALSPASSEVLDTIARRAPAAFVFDGASGQLGLAPHGRGVDGAFAKLFAIAHDAMIDGTWERLKACRKQSCRWAFYDCSKNRSASWCSMAVCGNRSKAQRRRARHPQAMRVADER